MSTSARTNLEEATADTQPHEPHERALTIEHTYAEGTTRDDLQPGDLLLHRALRAHHRYRAARRPTTR